ncbi:hypothetical protein GCM10011416_13800 [Polaribacter pacificus]|uniref:DUF4136 domain-containing protein n=1 Tax=Polaribacter pacificus TaxID=1775173 RepID=A0A917MFK9_9FLAO|nr:DUF4136 domain-containing protein [Polaribacter pacificus]GGG97080.1 hypothetical protein GCM10011416_13800 [Polaribacter pacificus]
MKLFNQTALLFVFILSSCSVVRVSTDYDTKKDFTTYKTFAFYKTGIDKTAISDLDKRRILRAIESELLAKGFKKSNSPDVLVSIYAKSRNRVDVTRTHSGFNNLYWYPMYYRANNRVLVTKYTEGTLFIDLIDAQEKQLVWQGIGTGALKTNNVQKKEEKIKEFVKEILSNYPPGSKK